MVAAELLKAKDLKTHVRAEFLRIFAKFVLMTLKEEKQALFMILAQFDKILKQITCFYGILGQFLCAEFSVKNLAAQKNLLL